MINISEATVAKAASAQYGTQLTGLKSAAADAGRRALWLAAGLRYAT